MRFFLTGKGTAEFIKAVGCLDEVVEP